jgi:hypothetical protein
MLVHLVTIWFFTLKMTIALGMFALPIITGSLNRHPKPHCCGSTASNGGGSSRWQVMSLFLLIDITLFPMGQLAAVLLSYHCYVLCEITSWWVLPRSPSLIPVTLWFFSSLLLWKEYVQVQFLLTLRGICCAVYLNLDLCNWAEMSFLDSFDELIVTKRLPQRQRSPFQLKRIHSV